MSRKVLKLNCEIDSVEQADLGSVIETIDTYTESLNENWIALSYKTWGKKKYGNQDAFSFYKNMRKL